MNETTLYLQVYQMFDKVTPLRFDCGRLCHHLCCRGDAETGMYLFPGEARLHQSHDILTIIPANFTIAGEPVLLATCSGSCERALRPLACRIFPLTPLITAKDILTVIPDPRAKDLCPLTQPTPEFAIQPKFKNTVRRAFSLLIQDPEIKGFVREFSQILTEPELF